MEGDEINKVIVNNITRKVGDFLTESRTNLSELSRKTGIPYRMLYASVWNRKRTRELRANELMSICVALNVNPMDFVDNKDDKEEMQKWNG